MNPHLYTCLRVQTADDRSVRAVVREGELVMVAVMDGHVLVSVYAPPGACNVRPERRVAACLANQFGRVKGIHIALVVDAHRQFIHDAFAGRQRACSFGLGFRHIQTDQNDCRQNSDNPDDNQQFYQREAFFLHTLCPAGGEGCYWIWLDMV